MVPYVYDELAGDITQFDIIRALPFGGGIPLVEMKGSLLKQVLEVGRQNKGSGGFLQYSGIKFQDEKWLINSKPIAHNTVYKVAIA